MQKQIRFEDIIYELARQFEEKNAVLWAVGGAVRDKILGIIPKHNDIDLVSTLQLEEVELIAKNLKLDFKIKNKKLGTASININEKFSIDYAMLRKEIYLTEGVHNPSVVEFTDNVFEDSTRRDFTINSIYFNILNSEIVDFYGGVEDLNTKRIRAVSNDTLRFDGARILRMIALCTRLGFSAEKTTLRNAKKYKKNINELSSERLNKEIANIKKGKDFYSNFINHNFKNQLEGFKDIIVIE